MFVAYLRTFARMGLKAIPMRAETGPIGGDLSHEFIVLAETGESGCLRQRRARFADARRDVDYDGDLTPIIKQWTSVYAATEDVHDAARFEREVPADKRCTPAASRSARSSISAPNIPTPMKAWSRARRRRRADPWRLLRRRRLAPGRRDHRGLP
jgi:prolyl-tRNA synthetase